MIDSTIVEHFTRRQISGEELDRRISETAFETYWPDADRTVAIEDELRQYIAEMPEQLQEVLNRLHSRLMWAVNKQSELLALQARQTLDSEDKKILQRCTRFIEGLGKRELPTYTLTTLASEGFLPGYGMFRIRRKL